MRILIVTRDKKLADSLSHDLRQFNFAAECFESAETGYDYILSGVYDVALFDVTLPDVRPNLLGEIRAEHITTPILCLCGDSVSERIRLLDEGADDCVSRDCVYEELLSRIRALSRRQVIIQLDSLDFADLSLFTADMTLHCAYRSVKLSYKEFEVMRIMMLNSHSIIRKETLLTKIWKSDSEAVYNNVEAYISLLRKKLFQIGSEVYITAIRGVGYQLEFKQPT